MDLVHLRPSSTSPGPQQFKSRTDSGMQLQLMVQQRMLQQKRNMYHRHRGSGSPTPLSSLSVSSGGGGGSPHGSLLFRRNVEHVPRQNSYKLAQKTQIVPPLNHATGDTIVDFERDRERDEERWKSLPSRLAADCQLAERTLLWSQEVIS